MSGRAFLCGITAGLMYCSYDNASSCSTLHHPGVVINDVTGCLSGT